jgi:hypothetical protein
MRKEDDCERFTTYNRGSGHALFLHLPAGVEENLEKLLDRISCSEGTFSPITASIKLLVFLRIHFVGFPCLNRFHKQDSGDRVMADKHSTCYDGNAAIKASLILR